MKGGQTTLQELHYANVTSAQLCSHVVNCSNLNLM